KLSLPRPLRSAPAPALSGHRRSQAAPSAAAGRGGSLRQLLGATAVDWGRGLDAACVLGAAVGVRAIASGGLSAAAGGCLVRVCRGCACVLLEGRDVARTTAVQHALGAGRGRRCGAG